MKHVLLIAVAAAVCAALLAGCPGKDNKAKSGASRDEVIAGLDKMGLDKATELGPVFKDFLLAIYDKKYDSAWDMLSKSSQDKADRELQDQLTGLRESISKLDAEASDRYATQDKQDYYKMQLAAKQKRLNALAPLIGTDGSKYFAYLMGSADVAKGFDDIAYDRTKAKFTGESVSGDSGYITEQVGQPSTTQKLLFVKEGGKWKFDFYSLVPGTPAAPSRDKP